ncbi:MAG TPA: hypothetical protein VE242_07975 [Chthoniobacterales bacterium]|nr:hypothetical protein [Chthoniobacterales bacterium]
MSAENRVPARLIFLIAAGLLVMLASCIAAWLGGTFLINQYAQAKIAEAIKSLNLEKNVRYREAHYNLFSGATVLRDVEIKLSESTSPIKVTELRIDQFREENGVPMELKFTAADCLVTPECMPNPQARLAMVLTGLNTVKGSMRCDIAMNASDRTLKVRRYAIHLDDLIDANIQLEYHDVNVDKWKSLAQGSGLAVGVGPQILEQLMAGASFVSLDSELVDLGLTDRIVDWGSRITGSTKEQFRATTQQQLMSRLPDDLADYRAVLARILQQRSRIRFSLHPDPPISLSDPLFADPPALQRRLGIKLEVTPVGK